MDYYIGPSNHYSGMNASLRSMVGGMKALTIHADNITRLGVPGYQANRVVRRRFVEHLGPQSIESVTDTTIGRLRQTGRGEDFALGTEGYFQVFNPNTGQVTLTRSGQSQIDAEGYMRTVTGEHFLDAKGNPIKFPNKPTDAGKQIKIDEDGRITYRDDASANYVAVGQLGIATPSGDRPEMPQVYHMHLEESNVTLQEEFMSLLPAKRYFEAGYQVFKLQSEGLQRMLQELGRPQ